MTFRSQATAALAVLGFAAVEVAHAQPVPPARPTYSSYSSIIRPGGGGAYYGFGFPQQDSAALVQNQLLAQQINQTNQAINGLQTYLATGINPNLGITGRGAVYNSLGHWYPSARNGGGGGGFGGGMVSPNRPLMGVGNNMLRTAALAGALGAGPFGGGQNTGGAGVRGVAPIPPASPNPTNPNP
ncbi:MAG TPA: hypothetical protein VMZ71_09535, partial [Gemmataceae bacterium]|nr:hypothetical protein [Gemmataceae bacterium]